MPLFGKKKQTAFEIRLNPTARDKAAAAREAAKDKAIAILAREKKKQAEREALVDAAEELKEKAQKRKEEQQAAAKREASRKRRAAQNAEPAGRTACTCKKPTVGRDGKCKRCHKVPASRKRGLFGLCLVRHRTAVRTARSGPNAGLVAGS